MADRGPRPLTAARFTTGADFESGRAHERLGRNEPQPPGVDLDFQPAGDDPNEQRGLAGTGLGAPRTVSTSRRPPAKTMPARMGPLWATVEVVGRHYETNPNLRCKDCSHTFSGGVGRIEDHIATRSEDEADLAV